MRVLLDTCVIIDALQSRAEFSEDAKTLFLMIAEYKFNGYISAKSATDIYYLMHRFTHNDKMSREVLSNLFMLFDILDTSGDDCKQALISNITDYKDAIMIETAKRSHIDCIVTRNLHDYIKTKVPVFTPKEFINHYNLTNN